MMKTIVLLLGIMLLSSFSFADYVCQASPIFIYPTVSGQYTYNTNIDIDVQVIGVQNGYTVSSRIKDSSGNVIGEKVEAWDLISFFIKGQPSGTIKYEDSTSKKDSDRLRQPVDVGNSNNPLEIGTGFQVNAKKLDGGGSTFLFQAPFTGIISELSIWNKALTSSEIAARRNLRGNEKGLVSWWQFQEGRGKIAYDSKSTNHANLKGSLPWVKDPNPNGSRLSLFLNGESLVSDILDKDALPAGSEQFSLGALKTNSGLDELFQGELEEVRIWQVERTQEQIQDNLFRRLTGRRKAEPGETQA